jgi:hypothetical protein
MNAEITILLFTAATVGFLHTLSGPDHYLPFIVLGRARGWTNGKTLRITFLCGLGHVGSSVLIGIAGIILGFGVSKLETAEVFRGNAAAWAFVFFGLIYFMWGIRKALKGKPHQHIHLHRDGSVHFHEHHHSDDIRHEHTHPVNDPVNITPWILFIIFVLGPCEPLIPLLIYPAAKIHVGVMVSVVLLFSVITVATMMTAVFLALKGVDFLPVKTFEKYLHAIAGATILLCGIAILFLGL